MHTEQTQRSWFTLWLCLLPPQVDWFSPILHALNPYLTFLSQIAPRLINDLHSRHAVYTDVYSVDLHNPMTRVQMR